MYPANRLKVLDRIRSAGAAVPGELIFMLGNKQEERSNSDTDILFRQDSTFLYERARMRVCACVSAAPLIVACGEGVVVATATSPGTMCRTRHWRWTWTLGRRCCLCRARAGPS
jgi:hypothetical protein